MYFCENKKCTGNVWIDDGATHEIRQENSKGEISCVRNHKYVDNKDKVFYLCDVCSDAVQLVRIKLQS